MTFHDDLFPTSISYGSLGGPGFRTNLATGDTAVTEAVARWSRIRRRYDVSYGIKGYADLKLVRAHYVARMGPANTFPFKDPVDFTTDADATAAMYQTGSTPTDTDVLLGTGDGTTVDFQLRQVDTSGGYSVYTPITKPVSGTVVVSLDDVSQGSGWTVNTATGVLTFGTAPGNGVLVKAGCEYYVPVRYAEEMDAQLPTRADDFSTGSIPSIVLVEDIDGSTVNEDIIHRRGSKKQFSTDITIANIEGYVFQLDPAGAGLTVTVEAAADLASGGDWYLFENIGSDSLTINGGATTIGTLTAGSWGELVIFEISGVKTWKMLS